MDNILSNLHINVNKTINTNAFFISGHGIEYFIPFEKRERIPPGITLVTISECAEFVNLDKIYRFIREFAKLDNENIFLYPYKNIKKLRKIPIIGNSFRIYTEGMYYPSLSIQLFLDFTSEEYENTLTAVKSGVYSFPLDRELWRLDNNNEWYIDVINTNIIDPNPSFTDLNKISTLYTDSLLPTDYQVESFFNISKYKKMDKFKERVTYSINKIFEKLGPGVYYYISCRGIQELVNLAPLNINFNRIPSYIENTQYLHKLKENQIKHNKNKLSKELESSVEKLSLSNIIKIEGLKYNKNKFNKLKKLYNNTKNIRRKSINRQLIYKYGGTRKRKL